MYHVFFSLRVNSIFKDNFFFHGFGKFLALPGSGCVSSETDPDPKHCLKLRFMEIIKDD